jgi:hypothetical protein
MKIGFDTRREGGAWGAAAKGYVSVEYRGARGMRLVAHRAADKDPSREYCVEDYRSGKFVSAAELRLECWSAGGDGLGSFAEVDKFALELAAGHGDTAFDMCVTGIQVGESP